MDQDLLNMFISRSSLPHPGAVRHIERAPDPEALCRAYFKAVPEPPMVVMAEDLERFAGGSPPPETAPSPPAPPPISETPGGYTLLQPQAHPSDRAAAPPTTPPGATPPPPSPPPSHEVPAPRPAAHPPPGPAVPHIPNPETPSFTATTGVPAPPDGPDNGWSFRVLRDITGESTCEGSLADFNTYFRDRFRRLREILKHRQEAQRAVPIGKMARGQKDTTVIGIVREVSITQKKKHKILLVEDESGETNVLLNRNRDDGLADTPIVEDEVIAVTGTVSPRDDHMLWADSIVRPELELNRETRTAGEEVYAAFISDLHVGSRNFLHTEWETLLDWFGGGVERLKEVALKIRYLVISGDAVDGIGIYPRQHEDLEIPDIDGQYRELARILESIPRRVKIILQPGNHDAVRPAEPQPRLPEKYMELFPPNVEFVGNPCTFELEGVRVLSYHGSSLFDFITKIPGHDMSRPVDVMKEMLLRRHLAPVYGDKTPLAPEHSDHMVIDQVPDILVTGHIHSHGVDTFRDVLCINASTWQSQTEYQKMLNFKPEPGKLTLVDLSTLRPRVVNFVA